MKLLIVDDDLNTVEVIRDSIEWQGMGITGVFEAYNVAGAQKVIREENPSIILCDIEMPRGSGIDLLKWIRNENFCIEFIFLTCHESFDFASQAIEYGAIGYVTKPFNAEKTMSVVYKAVNKIRNENQLRKFSEYGKYWVDNRQNIEENFWRDLLFYKINLNEAAIKSELIKRKLDLSVRDDYRLILLSVIKSQVESDWQTGYFEYALRNLSSEVITGEINSKHAIVYDTNLSYYVIFIVNTENSIRHLSKRCSEFINLCKCYLNCVANCYISESCKIFNLAQARGDLEQIDRNTLVTTGRTICQEDKKRGEVNEAPYSLDYALYMELLEQGEQLKIVTNLKSEVETFASGDNNLSAFNSIYQDFIQIIYSVLNKHEIQAHQLFEDEISKKLSQNAVHSTFDMLKWANYASAKAIDIINQTRKSQNVVEKAKSFIHENYSKDISRTEIALYVYLTPDYLSKLFKAETGVSLVDYINQMRIKKAKELLLDEHQNISNIAVQVGFCNISYFSTIFKKTTGKTPNEFRKEKMKNKSGVNL